MHDGYTTMRKLTLRRMSQPRRNSAWVVVATLFTVAAVLFFVDLVHTRDSSPTHAPQELFSASTAKLDDPLELQQQLLARLQAPGPQPSTPSPSTAARMICSNTCFKAKDGVCDEGRRGNLTVAGGMNSVSCDLGTDCDDCGPWHGVQHGPAWSESVGPIAYLRLYSIEVRTKQVPYEPKFIFAFTDPAVDSDQSAHMKANGVVEGGISQVFYKVLSKRCSPAAPGTAGLVVDVGANFGWFSLLSAALGCRVVAVEPVPIFRAFMEYSAARNHLTDSIELIPAVVAPDVTKTYTINAPLVTGAQWGASGMDVPNHAGTMQIPARAVRLDDLAYSNRASSGNDTGSYSRSLREAPRSPEGSRSSSSRKATITVSSSSSTHLDVHEIGAGSTDSVGSSNSNSRAAASSSDTADATSADLAGSKGGSDQQRQQKLQQQQPQLGSHWLLEKLVTADIDILKVDVEGREPDVFATATRLLDSGKVQNIIMEYSPGYWYQASDRMAEMEQLPLLLLNILHHNYSMVHIPWSIAHDVRAVQQAGSWNVPVPAMDAVTAPQLAYDLWTTQSIRNGTLPGMYGPSSWPCPEMAKSGMSFAEPGHERYALHVAFHPKAFMAHFIFNTNVWATKDKSLQQPGPGLFNDREMFPFYYPSDIKWFPQSATQDTHAFGMPWAYCEHVAAKFQVAHRCRCRDWDACGQHQVAVQQCVQKKHTGYTNIGDELLRQMLAEASAKSAARSHPPQRPSSPS